MKTRTGLVMFVFFLLVLGSCFNPPEFSTIPSIDFVKVEFVPSKQISGKDSLILFLNFKDGDGDLGLNESYVDSPYHEINYFLTNSTVPVPTVKRYANIPPLVSPRTGQTGKLETVRSKNQPFQCTNFIYDSVFVDKKDKGIFDNTYNLYAMIKNPEVYVLLDTFYYEPNPNHYNIEVDFLVKGPTGTFTEYNWWSNFCTTFDGRFPVLSKTDTPLEGTLKYSMNSLGFKYIFSTKTLKLRIQIKDRSLNKSNVIQSQEFTLKDITKGI